MSEDKIKAYCSEMLKLADFSFRKNLEFMSRDAATFDRGRMDAYRDILNCLEEGTFPNVQSISSANEFFKKSEDQLKRVEGEK